MNRPIPETPRLALKAFTPEELTRIWEAMPGCRSGMRLALRAIRDDQPLPETVKAKLTKAIGKLYRREVADSELPSLAATILGNRKAVAQLAADWCKADASNSTP